MARKTYRGRDIDVTFDADICIHAAECLRRLPSAFDINKRPWVQPDNVPTDQIQTTIDHCPSGALKYVRHDDE
ncbi:MAG: hypothetical protein GY755_05055 [Chloroflexi bacterium]|nr:hypothetical protein [Chloroflexota bacterium]